MSSDWTDLEIYRVHRPVTFVYAGDDREETSCQGCGQQWPCDAFRLAGALVQFVKAPHLKTWHYRQDDARRCTEARCKAAMHVLDTPQQSDMYGNEP